jgi:hypothetical protein
MSLSAEDRRMLEELLTASPEPDEEERFRVGPFQEMLARDRELSQKQRKWLTETHERICGEVHYENLISSGKAPRGREVSTPAVLLNLPKRPPTRRTDDGS